MFNLSNCIFIASDDPLGIILIIKFNSCVDSEKAGLELQKSLFFHFYSLGLYFYFFSVSIKSSQLAAPFIPKVTGKVMLH